MKYHHKPTYLKSNPMSEFSLVNKDAFDNHVPSGYFPKVCWAKIVQSTNF